jgi:hypothetical protein
MNSIEIKDFADFLELLSTFVPDRLKQKSPSIMIVKEKGSRGINATQLPF